MKMLKEAVFKAAVKWWRGRRPYEYRLKEHLDNPTVNTHDHNERRLAKAVAAAITAAKGK